jgi:hypothetical protein
MDVAEAMNKNVGQFGLAMTGNTAVEKNNERRC